MSHSFEETPLWRRTLASRPDDVHAEQRQALRFAYLQFRTVVEALAGEIAIALPMFTDHSIKHADALWDTASQLCGEDFPINPAEAFVLGGAFLLHDLGMGLASFPGGMADLEADPNFNDLVAAAEARLGRADPSTPGDVITQTACDEAVAELLRLRHAKQAERLISTQFHTSSGEVLYLVQDAALRQTFGELIGQIAHSHWWAVDQLRKLPQRRGAYADHPGNWELNPLKIACVLRLADAAQIDSRRAPIYLHAFRRPTGISRYHWYFQERLTRPLVHADRFVYTSTRSFHRKEAAAWWLAFETIQTINRELRQVDALCADLDLPRFAVRSIAGAEAPERLAKYIETDGWKPIDARLRVTDAVQVVSNIGGEDLYGKRPDIAVRELVANASDATRARAVHEGSPLCPVIVRLSEEDDSWWLTVEDKGIGMAPETMVAALTDFGHSHWQSPSMLSDFPGLLTKGYTPTGRFGIGFFAVFMAADKVHVRSLSLHEAPRSTHVLEFNNGVAGRPLIREATSDERLMVPGTVVRARLRHDPRTANGIFRNTSRRRSHTQHLHAMLTQMCALAEVDIHVQGPEDSTPVCIVRANDWIEIPTTELFRRVYMQGELGAQNRRVLQHYQQLFAEQVTDLMGEDGSIVGRAMLSTGREAMQAGFASYMIQRGHVYVGGLESDFLPWVMGAFKGKPLTADRLRAFPATNVGNFRKWAESQAEVVRTNHWNAPLHRWLATDHVYGYGGEAPMLPCAECGHRALDQRQLIEWLENRDEVLLLSWGELLSLEQLSASSGPRVVHFNFEGNEVALPVNALIVDMNPSWNFPVEVAERPRDDRFADIAANTESWDPRNWWYDTGNFGMVGMVVRTIAETWGLDVVDTVNLMEACCLTDEEDSRLALPTTDGGMFRIDAIRLKYTGPSKVGECARTTE